MILRSAVILGKGAKGVRKQFSLFSTQLTYVKNKPPPDFPAADYAALSEATPECFNTQDKSFEQVATTQADRVLNLLRTETEGTFLHSLDLLEHSLQTATRAHRDGADEEVGYGCRVKVYLFDDILSHVPSLQLWPCCTILAKFLVPETTEKSRQACSAPILARKTTGCFCTMRYTKRITMQ